MVTSNPPTLTFSPSFAWILAIRPAFGEGISTFALSVRTETSGASSATVPPSSTNHLTTSPSATPSPMSGNRNSYAIEPTLPGRDNGLRGVDDPFGVRQVRVLESVRERRVVARDALDRGFQRKERLLGEDRRELRAKAAEPRRFVNDHRPTGL